MSYHTHSTSTGLHQTVTTLIVQLLAFTRLLPYTLSKYWTLSDCYPIHSPNTDLYLSYHTHSPSTVLYQTATSLIVQVLAFIRLIPHLLSKYWHLQDCYNTHCPITGICYQTHSPSTDLYLSYHTHRQSTVLYQTVTVHIIQILDSVRLLPHT